MAKICILRVVFINLSLIVALTLAGRDFYEILGVSKNTDTAGIKKAYRSLAKELHPDKNKNDKDASKKFQDLSAAYEVLSDPEKREKYDRCGEECLKGQDNMHDPFASFFGDFGFFGGGDSRQQEHETPQGAHVTMDLWVTLEELYNGGSVDYTRNKLVTKPGKGTRKCNCRQELVTRNLGPGKFQMMQKTVCSDCPNVDLVNEESESVIFIEAGMEDGFKKRLYGDGEPHIDGDHGHLYVIIRTIPHSIFERIGDDLYTNITISLQDALVGFSTTIEHLDGHKVTIENKGVTKPGSIIEKANEGMPRFKNNNLHGTLFITVDIDFPDKEFSSEEKEAIRQLLNQSQAGRVYNGIRGKPSTK